MVGLCALTHHMHSCLSFSPSLCPFFCFSLSPFFLSHFPISIWEEDVRMPTIDAITDEKEYSPLHQQGVLPVSENVVYVAEVTAYRCATEVLLPFSACSRCQSSSDANPFDVKICCFTNAV